MVPLAELKPGQAIWIDHYGPHPAVVLEGDSDAVLVIVGTSQRKEDKHEVCIAPNSAAAMLLGLSLRTYFYPRNVCVVRDSAAVKSVRPRRCPLREFHALETLAAIAASRRSDKK